MDPCPLCPRAHPPVPAVGPRGGILIIAEAPGSVERDKGIPFVGKTGEELTNQYLPLAGLSRSEVRICNTVNCYPPGNGKLDSKKPKDRELIKSCAEFHLYKEIEACNPTTIVSMGAVIGSLIPGLDLDVQWAFPFIWDVPGVGEYNLFPTFHPALGLHSPKEILRLRNCFIRLRKHLRGQLQLPQDKYPNPDYSVVTTVESLDEYFQQHTDTVVTTGQNMALDTEITRKREPYCLTFSIKPGTARLILATDKEILDRFSEWIAFWEGLFILHNRPFDRPILMQMGIHLPPHKIIDSMQEAWHLGNLQQGLKTLAYRQLGVEMQSFDDLVTPHSTSRCLAYLAQGLQVDWPKPPTTTVIDPKGEWREYKAHSFRTKLKGFFTALGKTPDKDIFEHWDKNWAEDHELIQNKLGPWPGKDIQHCPMEDILPYASADADMTLRLWPIMDKASKLVRKRPQESWYE